MLLKYMIAVCICWKTTSKSSSHGLHFCPVPNKGAAKSHPPGPDWKLGGSDHLSQVSLIHHKPYTDPFQIKTQHFIHFFSPFPTSFGLVTLFASVNRKDLSATQKECEEVKVRLRHKEKQVAGASKADGAPRVAGLCLRCAQHEAVMAGTHANLHVQTIDRLTK